jgi:hypothetical protein
VFADNFVTICFTFSLYLGSVGPLLSNIIIKETITVKSSCSQMDGIRGAHDIKYGVGKEFSSGNSSKQQKLD